MCRASRSVTLFPNDFISLKTSKHTLADGLLALEPRTSSKVFSTCDWPHVQTIQVIDNEFRLVNTTNGPIHIPKNEQICQVRATQVVDKNLALNYDYDYDYDYDYHYLKMLIQCIKSMLKILYNSNSKSKNPIQTQTQTAKTQTTKGN